MCRVNKLTNNCPTAIKSVQELFSVILKVFQLKHLLNYPDQLWQLWTPLILEGYLA